MSFMTINTESIRSYSQYMGGRIPGPKDLSWVGEDGCLNLQLDNGYETIVKFVNFDTVVFTYTTSSGSVVKKIATRPSEFNGFLIEFATKSEDHFEKIAEDFKSHPVFYKQYTVLEAVR